MSFLSHYKCIKCNKTYSLLENKLICDNCESMLIAEYDLYQARRNSFSPKDASLQSIWRYRELLPVNGNTNIASLQEGGINPIPLKKFSKAFGSNFYLLNEGHNPTGSIADREMSVLFSMMDTPSKRNVLIQGPPNACISAAAYAAYIGLTCHVVMPNTVPMQFLGELNSYGARVHMSRANMEQAKALESEIVAEKNLQLLTAGNTPYRLEGAKTLIYDIFLAFEGKFPDYIFIPLGESLSAIGIWKGLYEMKQLGWVNGRLPKVVLVESSHRAPVSEALGLVVNAESNAKDSVAVELDFGQPVEMDLIKNIIEELDWQVVALDDEDILKTRLQIAQREGVLISPEGSATIAAYQRLKNQIKNKSDLSILFVNPINGCKYVQSLGFLKN